MVFQAVLRLNTSRHQHRRANSRQDSPARAFERHQPAGSILPAGSRMTGRTVLAAANRMSPVEKVIPKFVSWDDGRISIRQLHLLADVTNASGHRQHQTWDEDDERER
jgi:hypothetical protein